MKPLKLSAYILSPQAEIKYSIAFAQHKVVKQDTVARKSRQRRTDCQWNLNLGVMEKIESKPLSALAIPQNLICGRAGVELGQLGGTAKNISTKILLDVTLFCLPVWFVRKPRH